MPAEGVNADGWSGLLDGTYHVGLGSLAVAGVGLFLIAGGGELLWIGVLLLIVGVGVLVDTWSHGWFH